MKTNRQYEKFIADIKESFNLITEADEGEVSQEVAREAIKDIERFITEAHK